MSHQHEILFSITVNELVDCLALRQTCFAMFPRMFALLPLTAKHFLSHRASGGTLDSLTAHQSAVRKQPSHV